MEEKANVNSEVSNLGDFEVVVCEELVISPASPSREWETGDY